ncbi:MAG: hypothetical protein ACOZBW_06230 [Thermodesulfobacteriota bacterium]
MQVKGTILLDLVRIIRSEKEKNWQPHLQPEDWEVVNGHVVASAWYPGDLFYRLTYAVFKVSGQSDLDVCFAYGRFTGNNLIQVYRNILVIGDPVTSVDRFVSRRKLFFGGEYSESEMGRVTHGNGWLKYLYTVADPAARGREVATVIAYSVAGGLHELVERTGADNVRTDITEKGGAFEIHITWS